ncbi:GLABROUS1 enhancer-binding protein-like 3 [Cardamine amara subsp. amara]|uniref:GLABROUS1 enhancer-binding protein-like 3 n=1 Tax=Cardamine amara subsp. amara TaxID=228776 RepID=A0ABD1C4F2_CARAN
MDARKRIGETSSYSNRDGSDSPMKHEDNISGTKEMIWRSKKPRMRTFPVTEKTSSSRLNWSKDEEILILLVYYENEFKLSYQSADSEVLYRYVENVIKSNFTKEQLVNKIDNLRKKFLIIQARSNTDDGEIARSNTHDHYLFNLSMIIWGRNETQFASVENSNQPKKDVPCVEQENRDLSCVEQENRDVPSEELERVEIDNAEKEKNEETGLYELHVLQEIVEAQPSFASVENSNQPKNVPCVEQENRDVPSEELKRVEIDNAEKEKSQEAGLNEQHVLQEIVEAQPSLKNLGKFQQKLLLADLGKLEVEKKHELIDEWKALVVEELQLDAKKKSFSAKLAKGGVFL